MKTTRYHLERVVESTSITNLDYVKDEIKYVLESNKDYRTKADYLGYSICTLDDKVKSIDEQINELKELKQRIKNAKALVLEIGAKVFAEFGIEKIEGNGISSITVSKELISSKTVLNVINTQALIDAGFYIKTIDEKAILESFNNDDYKELILANAEVLTTKTVTPSKLRVNKRRSNNDIDDIPKIA